MISIDDTGRLLGICETTSVREVAVATCDDGGVCDDDSVSVAVPEDEVSAGRVLGVAESVPVLVLPCKPLRVSDGVGDGIMEAIVA